MSSIVDRTLVLAARGLSVFPCLDTKAPVCPHGFKDATKDPDAVRVLWNRYPGPLVGVPTGEATGLDALDVDPRHHGNEWLDQHYAELPPTRTHRTRSGGWHLLFLHLEGVRNSAGRIAPGVDVRGEGGAIIWWPAAGFQVEHAGPLAQWPAWLRPLILPPPTPVYRHSDMPHGGSRYVEAALRSAAEHVAGATEGARNTVLNTEAFGLARFVRSGDLSAGDLAEALAGAALAAGLAPREIQATISSALRAGGVA